MPRERTLLERIAEPDRDADRTIHENTHKLVESVMTNVRNVLNSRHGIAQIQEDYGIPDLADVVHSFPEAMAMMRAAIRAAIEKYEPRLQHVQIDIVEAPDDPLALHFEITAQLVTSEEQDRVWFQTRIDSTGEVHLRS